MDRSSMRKVETTQDLEKRQAFKVKLASKIETPSIDELPATDDTFNGVSPGGKLVHPSLGEGVLVEVDHKNNEVLIDFASKGLIGLVLTQARSFVHAPLKEEAKIVDDPFIGGTIERVLPDRSDAAHREVNFSKVISPDFVDPEIAFIEEGAKVYHKELGDCTIVSLNKSSNEIVLDSSRYGTINLVFSQVKSVLTPIEAVRKEAKQIDDPFIGGKILRDGPVRPDAAQRELNTEKVVSSDFIDPEIAFIEEGAKVYHKELGDCTIISLNKASNEIVLNSDRYGNINLVFSQVKSVLTPVDVVRKEAKQVEDAFIGEKILRDGPVRPDVAQRELSTEKIISPDFIEPKKSFFPVGSSIWHPDLGNCTVVSLDEKANNITLSTSSNGVIDMVLSQVRSKLREIETVVEHVPLKPFIPQASAPQVPQYKSRGVVDIKLPEVFKTWQRNQQFMFLTRSEHLTTEQANDVFALLDGGTPLFHGVVVSWQTPEETQASIIPGPEALSTKVEKKTVYGILQQKNLWHPDFGECSVASVDGNNLILMTSVGQVPCVLDVTVPKLAVLDATAKVEHAPKRLGTRTVVTNAPIKERSKISVSLPEAFNSWKPVEQYQYLSRQVAPEHANTIIDIVAGKVSSTDYVITWSKDLPEANKRAEFKNQLLKRIEAASVEKKVPAPPTPVDAGIKRITEEVSVTKKTPYSKVSVDLPKDFKSWTSSGQYVFLTRSRHLTFNEANDVMDVLQNKPLKSTTKYEVIWTDDNVAYAAADGVRRTLGEIETVEKKNVLKKVEVVLPSDYKKWSNSKQYEFLTRARQLTFNEANDVVNIVQNKSLNSKIEYEIIWSE